MIRTLITDRITKYMDFCVEYTVLNRTVVFLQNKPLSKVLYSSFSFTLMATTGKELAQGSTTFSIGAQFAQRKTFSEPQNLCIFNMLYAAVLYCVTFTFLSIFIKYRQKMSDFHFLFLTMQTPDSCSFTF